MGIVKVESKRVGLHLVDDETGEIYHQVEPVKKKVTSFDKAVGVDTKYPRDCVTKESLLLSLSVMDAYLYSDVKINIEYILESILGGHITAQEGSLIKHLALNLVGWNYYIGSTQDLCTCGITAKNISSILNKLSPNILRILHRNAPFRGDIVIMLNPKYAWKGDMQYRDAKLKHWYEDTKLFTPKFKGIEESQTLTV